MNHPHGKTGLSPQASDAPMPALGDTISFDMTVKPPWWAFWRKPTTERRKFVVTNIYTGKP